MIWRDDDINVKTSATLFKRVNDLFKKYNQKHHVAVLFEDIFDNYELAHLLVKEDNIVINFHGWTHLKYGEEPYETIVRDIKRSLEYWNRVCKRRYDREKKIERVYPTWHCVSDVFEKASTDCGLIFDPRKESPVHVFHYWTLIEENEYNKMETLLQRHTDEKT